MGQQFSDENYCLSTIKKLSNELTTTDSFVSESQVVVSEGNICKISFPWREWNRVSKYLERILPNAEQKRLLEFVTLDQSGIRNWEPKLVWERITGLADYDDVAAYPVKSNNGNDYGGANYSQSESSGQPSLNLNVNCTWSVHLNYREHTDSNVILYRDFIKVHFRLDDVFSMFQQDKQSAPHSISRDSGLSVSSPSHGSVDSTSNSIAELSQFETFAIYRYNPDLSIQTIRCDTQELQQYIHQFVEHTADLVKKQCSKLAINLLVTNSQYHSRDNCIVISGTIDIRSILRNSGGIELRSRPNEEAEEQELSDHLQRSLNKIGGLKEKLISLQEEASASSQETNGNPSNKRSQQYSYYPMSLYYNEDTKRVTLIYRTEKNVADNGIK